MICESYYSEFYSILCVSKVKIRRNIAVVVAYVESIPK
jgi:hypothetical protein